MENIITRRVDELGRIVIPKEIRISMKIKPGDYINVFPTDEKIILKKKNVLDENFRLIENIIKIIKKISNITVIITDLYKIVYSSSSEKSIKDRNLENKITNDILKLKTIEGIDFNRDVMGKNHYLMQPIIINGDVLGSVIIVNDEEISEKDKLIMEIINNLIRMYLEV